MDSIRRSLVPIMLASFLLTFLVPGPAAAAVKVKVIVDNASIKATPEIGSQTLANVALSTVLDVELKQGEWYKVTTTKEGKPITGYIHELLVEETGEDETPPVSAPGVLAKSQAEIRAEIELKMEESKSLIRQERELDKAAEDLKPLLARAFSIDDRVRQRQIACEIYLWLGVACAKQGDNYGALKEFWNMFEVDYVYAKEVTRNIYEPTVGSFIDQAEKHYRGLLVDYTLEIATEPKEAAIKVDGKEVGLTPEVYRTPVPKFTLELIKEGFKPYKEEIFLSKASSKKDIVLESIGRTVRLTSVPPAAKVFLDGQDTGKLTDCELPYVAYGVHTLRLTKPNWADHEQNFEVLEGPDPLNMAAVLTVRDYVLGMKLGSPDGKFFRLPRAIAFDKEGFYYVADESELKVKKFDPQGRLLGSWGEASRDFRSLRKPSGIAIDSQGSLYITDAEAACVLKYSKDGRFITRWGKRGAKPDELMTPLGIALDRGGDVYVADSGNNRIVKYSAGGVAKKAWGKQGMGRGEFLFPMAVAVSPQNEIIVADRIRIQRFTPDGDVVAAWGKGGAGDGELNRPLGLAVDPKNYIYVADSGNNRVQKFDLDGRFIAKWGSVGTGDGQMTNPVAIAVNDKGSVFVVELDNNRIQEFKIPPQ